MAVLLVIVLCAAVAILLANRHNRTTGQGRFGVMVPLALIRISDDGLCCTSPPGPSIDNADELIDWASVIEVAVTNRRELLRRRFGFEILFDEGRSLAIDGASSDGTTFLAHSHHLPGFDHSSLVSALRARDARTICYSR